MKNLHHMILVGLAIGALAIGISPAYADKGGNGHGKGKWEKEDRHQGHDDDTTLIKIYDNDRVILRQYAEDHYHKSCPPGLAKKHNGCQPPGQAKKRYQIGHRLPDGVNYYVLPGNIVTHLRPVPSGYQYVRVDNDVLLINQATKMIVDAVTLLSSIK